MITTGGHTYEGSWENGEKNGRGKKTSSNGEVYEGHWKNGKRDGYGVLNDAHGQEIHSGFWKDDCFIRDFSKLTPEFKQTNKALFR